MSLASAIPLAGNAVCAAKHGVKYGDNTVQAGAPGSTTWPEPVRGKRMTCPLSIWYPLINDVALLLGARVLNMPRVHVAFLERGRRDVSFQRPVLMGFSKAANPACNVDLHRLVGTWANRVPQVWAYRRVPFGAGLSRQLPWHDSPEWSGGPVRVGHRRSQWAR